MGWLASFSNERVKWRRERAARWDESRLTAAVRYSGAVKRQVQLCLRIGAGEGLGTMDVVRLDRTAGLDLLNAAEEQRSEAFEELLLLFEDRTIEAARRWQEAVWELVAAVDGRRTVEQAEFMELFRAAGMVRDQFYVTVRSSLAITSRFLQSEAFGTTKTA
ncbi:hypothetical protein [Mycolicibacterium nivoides]|uniref:hypothetical protein n=1 Tax=Mycolicibacterium nivoides TaxID=2487344 RepID=UPI000F5B9229|nr:hypothetical protein [Mycolicibacterium nivoides]